MGSARLLPIPLWGTRVACLFLGSVKLGGDKKRAQMLTNSVLQIAYNGGGGGVVNLACCRYCWSRGLLEVRAQMSSSRCVLRRGSLKKGPAVRQQFRWLTLLQQEVSGKDS